MGFGKERKLVITPSDDSTGITIKIKFDKKRKPATSSLSSASRITIKVKSLQDNSKLFFKMKKSTKLQRLIDSYCDRIGVDKDNYMFLFNGRHIRGHQSPGEVGLGDGDKIFFVPLPPESTEIETSSGEESTPVTTPSASSTHKITVKVISQDNSMLYFRINRSINLQKLMDVYCERLGIDLRDYRFLFDFAYLMGHMTPDEVGLEDGDTIDCVRR